MKHLKPLEKIAYAAPAFSLAVVGIPVYIYIPKFYTDVVGVHISAMGTILLFVRLFDAITDPLIGLLSDRLKTPYGRRRPLILLGAVITAISIYLLFNPPNLASNTAAVWFTSLIFVLFLCWTIITVPYESLGPELTYDYDERTALFSVRDGALIAGTLIAAASPAMIKTMFDIPENHQGERDVFFLLSVLYVPLIVISAIWCVKTFRERPSPVIKRTENFIAGIKSSMRNRPFRILLISYTISAIGNNLPATLILYYVQYVLQSSLADVFLLIYFVTGIVFLPFWVIGSKKYEKKAMWLSAMAVNTGAFSGVFFLGPGDEMAYGILVFLSGIGFGATLAIPSAIQADVIDYDELKCGERREGLYIGLWSIAKKFAAAFGVGVGLTLLGATGYTPNVDQSESVVYTLRILYALVPSCCNLLAIMIALNYPITHSIHNDIRKRIEDRIPGHPIEDPLEKTKKNI